MVREIELTPRRVPPDAVELLRVFFSERHSIVAVSEMDRWDQPAVADQAEGSRPELIRWAVVINDLIFRAASSMRKKGMNPNEAVSMLVGYMEADFSRAYNAAVTRVSRRKSRRQASKRVFPQN